MQEGNLMNNIYEDIAKRTQGDIYIGVVGPVRTGKSTFIRKFMENLVLPNIENEFKRERTQDEIPQSGSGKTIMTVEPKFVPADGVEIKIKDKTVSDLGNIGGPVSQMADPSNKLEVGASIPGTAIKVLVEKGDVVKEGQTLLVIEAMKMETNIIASTAGSIEDILVKEGQRVKTGELLVKIK